MTLGAGGVGLNLTAADYVFILDPWWNPAKDRPVTAMRFIAKDTIEEKILLLQDKKRQLGKDLFTSGAEYPKWDREDLEMVLA